MTDSPFTSVPVSFEGSDGANPNVSFYGTATINLRGPVGPEGPEGPMGPGGPAGADGREGPIGPQGVPGNDGKDGPRGPIGADGQRGPEGLPGLDGAPGAQGPIGPQVERGLTGAEGPQGPIGPQGERGPAGTDGAAGPVGPKGDQGIQGERGPMGPDGIDGDDGAPGPAGPAGPAGVQGPIGATGPKGDQGIQGLRGDTGATGAQGPKGDQGIQGPKGDTGTSGVRAPSTIYTADAQTTPNPATLIDGDLLVSPSDYTIRKVKVNNGQVQIDTLSTSFGRPGDPGAAAFQGSIYTYQGILQTAAASGAQLLNLTNPTLIAGTGDQSLQGIQAGGQIVLSGGQPAMPYTCEAYLEVTAAASGTCVIRMEHLSGDGSTVTKTNYVVGTAQVGQSTRFALGITRTPTAPGRIRFFVTFSTAQNSAPQATLTINRLA